MKRAIRLFIVIIMLAGVLPGLESGLVSADIAIEGTYTFKRQIDAEIALNHPAHQDDPEGTEYFYVAEFNISVIDDNSIQFDGYVFDDATMHTGEVDGTANRMEDGVYRFTYEDEYLLFKFSGDTLTVEESVHFSFHGARVTFAHEYQKKIHSYDDILKIESDPSVVEELNHHDQMKDVIGKLSWLQAFGDLPEFNNISQVTDEQLILMALRIGVYEKNLENTKEYIDSTLLKMFGKTVTAHKSMKLPNGFEITYENGRYSELPGSGVPGIASTIYQAQKINQKYLLAIKSSYYDLEYGMREDAAWDGVMMFLVIDQADNIVKGISLDGSNKDSQEVSLNDLTVPDIKVILNGNPIVFDQPPIIEEGRTLVPMRAIFEALGATVLWENDTQTVTATKGDIIISMQIGNHIMTKNGQDITLDVPPKIVGGRTLAPARAVAEGFHTKVDWDAVTQTVIITQ